MAKKELVGHITVDSGGILVCDPCYLCEDSLGMSMMEWYDKCYCGHEDPTEEIKMGGFATSLVSHSGFGDGTYPVYATYVDGRVASLEIRFIESQ
jgi:hypothetical protein